MLDVFGASLLNRVTQRMQQHGIASMAVILEYDPYPDGSVSCDLPSQVQSEIVDARLIGKASTGAPVRALSDMLSLALYMPKALVVSLRAKRGKVPVTLPEAIQASPPIISGTTMEQESCRERRFGSEFMVARRYGDE